MTDRPTAEEVDEALAVVADEVIGCDHPTVYLEVLAAEVRALRAELAELREAAQKAVVDPGEVGVMERFWKLVVEP